jgi:hypothetical protein
VNTTRRPSTRQAPEVSIVALLVTSRSAEGAPRREERDGEGETRLGSRSELLPVVRLDATGTGAMKIRRCPNGRS